MKPLPFLLILVIIFTHQSFAQPGSKTKPANPGMSKQAEKMMEDALKAQGMSKEEIAEMKGKLAEAQQTMGEMQAQGVMPTDLSKPELKLPAKRTALLSQIPKLAGAQQYAAYVKQLETDCRAKLSKTVIAKVDATFAAQPDLAGRANLVPMYLLQKQANAAIYAAAKAAVAFPSNKNVQNNLGVTLHQTGYAHKAIPVLQYLETQQSDPIYQVNLGQCYLSLGDTAKARGFFMSALRAAPDNVSALCGTALILDAGGKKTEATKYVKQVMKNGYSALAHELAEKNKIKFKFSEIRQDVPEYFNARMYKPTESATDVKEVRAIDAKRLEQHFKYEAFSAKSDEFHEQNEATKENESLAKVSTRYAGYIGAVWGTGGIMAGKARIMFEAASQEYGEFMIGRYRTEMETTEAANRARHTAFVERVSRIRSSVDDNEEECKQMTEALNEYLKATSYARDQAIRNTLHQQYDYENQKMHWLRFLIHNDEYKARYMQTVTYVMKQMNEYDDLQMLYPGPENVLYNCSGPAKVKEKKKNEDSTAIPEPECPLALEIPFGTGKAKLSCTSFSIEGGEGLQGSFEKNFRTGEMTFFVGVGVSFYEKGGIGGVGGGIEAGAKVGGFLTVDGSGNVIDYGDKGEIGAEGGIGPLTTEAKLTGVLGMESGGKLSTNVAGKETVIWKTE